MARRGSLDILRVVALIVVFYQHACSVAGKDEWILIGQYPVGRFGTATFFALSGMFAASSLKSPEKWLFIRLHKIFPAYWIVLVISFAAVGLVKAKQFDWYQFVCQFIGIGLFTHGDNLVNVVTWFVSLLIVLYLVVYIAKKTAEPFVLGILLFILILCLILDLIDDAEIDTILICHSMTFLLSYIISRAAESKEKRSILYAIGAGLFAILDQETFYGAVAFILIAIANYCDIEWKFGKMIASVSYEWFLVHGICLHVAMLVAGNLFVPFVVVAFLLAGVSAYLLHSFVLKIQKVILRTGSPIVASAS